MKKLFLLIFLILPYLIFSQTKHTFGNKGQFELSGTIGYSYSKSNYASDKGTHLISVSVSPSYFPAKSIAAKVSIDYQYYHYSKAGSYSTILLIAGPEYNFDLKSNLWPYIGGQIGIAEKTDLDIGFAFKVAGGMKYIIKGGVVLIGGITYSQTLIKNKTYDIREGKHILEFNIGAGIIL